MLRQMKGMMSEAEAKIKVPKTRAGLEGARVNISSFVQFGEIGVFQSFFLNLSGV